MDTGTHSAPRSALPLSDGWTLGTVDGSASRWTVERIARNEDNPRGFFARSGSGNPLVSSCFRFSRVPAIFRSVPRNNPRASRSASRSAKSGNVSPCSPPPFQLNTKKPAPLPESGFSQSEPLRATLHPFPLHRHRFHCYGDRKQPQPKKRE